MAFLIKYDDITNVYLFSNSKVSGWSKQLQNLKTGMTEFSALTSFQGAAADNVRSYLQDVHGTIQVSIQEILNEFCARFLLYRDGYYSQIDNDSHAVLTEDTFNQLLSFYPSSQASFEGVHSGLAGTINSISDIFGPGIPDASGVRQGYETVKSMVMNLRDTTGSYETGHAGSDLTNLDALIASLSTFITYYRDVTYASAAPGYIAGSAGTCPAAADLGFALDKAYNDRAALSDELTTAVGNEKTRMEALEKEWADQRADDGAYKWVMGAGAVLVGTIAIVATAGAATPLVVAAVVAGSCSIAYGASNMYEAEQDIAYGLAGDPYTIAGNPIRDTIFFGNQEAYEIWGNTSTFVAGILIPVGTGLSAARAAGATGTQAIARVVGVEVLKDTIAGGAGMVGGYAGTYYGTEWFGPKAGRWIGLATGVAAGITTGSGMNKLDRNFNLNGLQPAQPVVPVVKEPEVGAAKIINKDGSIEIIGKGDIGEVIDNRPYLDPNSRPSLRKGVVEDVWNTAKEKGGGSVTDPNTPSKTIEWEPGQSRKDVWDMGHLPEAKYSDMHKAYLDGDLTPAEFRDWYNDPNNYRPELPSNNRGHAFE